MTMNNLFFEYLSHDFVIIIIAIIYILFRFVFVFWTDYMAKKYHRDPDLWCILAVLSPLVVLVGLFLLGPKHE